MNTSEEFQQPAENEEALSARLYDVWTKKMQAINALVKTDPDAFDAASEKIPDFVDHLKEKYAGTELRTYKLYHLLIGSSVDNPEEAPYFDLPKREIQRFIEKEL